MDKSLRSLGYLLVSRGIYILLEHIDYNAMMCIKSAAGRRIRLAN